MIELKGDFIMKWNVNGTYTSKKNKVENFSIEVFATDKAMAMTEAGKIVRAFPAYKMCMLIKETKLAETDETTEIKREIVIVLRKYFSHDDSGNPNKSYDENFSAQEAIDEIHYIIGRI